MDIQFPVCNSTESGGGTPSVSVLNWISLFTDTNSRNAGDTLSAWNQDVVIQLSDRDDANAQNKGYACCILTPTSPREIVKKWERAAKALNLRAPVPATTTVPDRDDAVIGYDINACDDVDLDLDDLSFHNTEMCASDGDFAWFTVPENWAYAPSP